MSQDSHESTAARAFSPWKWIAWTAAILIGLWIATTAVHRHRMEKIRTEVESRGGRLEGQELTPAWYQWLEANAPTDWLKLIAFKGRANFRRVVAVLLPPGGHTLPPDFFSRLTIFRHVEQLDLPNCNLDDRDLEKLTEFRELSYLGLSGNRVSDIGVAGLDRLPNLRQLQLAQTRVSDGVLRQVSSHPSVVSLNVSETLITDDGLRALGSPPRLQYLYLKKTRVSDSGLAALSAQPLLKSLKLTGCPISDRGLQEITNARFPSLNSLDIAETQVTADGIAAMELNSLHELKWLIFPKVSMKNPHWKSLAAIKSLMLVTWGDVQLRREFEITRTFSRIPLDSFQVLGLPGRRSYPFNPPRCVFAP